MKTINTETNKPTNMLTFERQCFVLKSSIWTKLVFSLPRGCRFLINLLPLFLLCSQGDNIFLYSLWKENYMFNYSFFTLIIWFVTLWNKQDKKTSLSAVASIKITKNKLPKNYRCKIYPTWQNLPDLTKLKKTCKSLSATTSTSTTNFAGVHK